MSDVDAICPHCERPITPGAPKGLCPACLASSLSELFDEATGGESAPPPPLAAPNERVGDYELIDELGRGGMGVVFRARDRRLNRVVALKLILTGQLASDGEVKRFRNEAEAAARLEHPNIVPIYEVGESEGRHFFAMQLVEGGTLSERISNLKSQISNRDAATLLATVAHAVHHAHQRGILHRDLKPGNILLDAAGQPRVADFGLARQMENASSLTLSGAVVGSPSYMAPEQATGGSRALTTAADIYSLGAILYELLCGQPPFAAATPLETLRKVVEEEPVPPRLVDRKRGLMVDSRAADRSSPSINHQLKPPSTTIDRDLETICLKCLRKDPHQRYATAEALAEDLERWLGHEPIRARPSGVWERVLKWTKRHPARAGLVAVALLAPAVIITGLLVAGAKLTHERNLALEQKSIATNETLRATVAQRSAESNAQIARLNLYAADIHLAAQMVEAGRLGPALDLLRNHVPALGEPDLRGFEWRWLRSKCAGDPARVLDATSSPVHTLAFSADRRRMASGGREIIRLWNTENWQPVASIPRASVGAALAELGNPTPRGLAQLDHDPKNLATGIVLLLGLTGLPASSAGLAHPDEADATLALAWSPDGRTLATVGNMAFVKFWDVASSRIRTWCELKNAQVAFLADGSVVALGEISAGTKFFGKNLRRVDPATGQARETLASDITSFAVSANGRWLAAVAARKQVVLLAGSNLVEVARFQVADELNGPLAVSSDGQKVASVAYTWDHVRIFNAAKDWQATVIDRLHSQVLALAFSPDERRLAFGMRDSTVGLYDTATGKALRQFTGHRQEVLAVAWGPGGELISAGKDGELRLWDLAVVQRDARISTRFFCPVVSPRSDQFAGVAMDDKIILWDGYMPDTRVLNDRPSYVPLAFRPEEAALLVAPAPGDWRRTLELWRLTDGATLRKLQIPFAGRALASSRGDRVVLWNATTAVVYDMAQGTELARWRADPLPFRDDLPWHHTTGVFTGERLLALAGRGAALWEVATGRCLSTVQPPERVETECVAMTPDDALVLTGDNDHRIRVWGAEDGHLLRTLAGHSGAVKDLAVSPDGRTLVSWAEDRYVKLWSLATGRELMTMPETQDLSRVFFTPDGLGLVLIHSWSGAKVWRIGTTAK